jgi:hypothetical protein
LRDPPVKADALKQPRRGGVVWFQLQNLETF